jgi:hypothetical protein
MADNIIELSEDEFDALFPLVPNHLNPSAGWAVGNQGGCLFETFGEELAFVRQQDIRCVWTVLDSDDGDLYVASGFHFVNRIGYLVSRDPVSEGKFIQVRIPMESEPAEDVPETATVLSAAELRRHIDVHDLLAERRQVAIVWSAEDVQSVRPDLTDDQAWEVLQQCRKVQDCEIGFNWLLIELVADDLYPDASDD